MAIAVRGTAKDGPRHHKVHWVIARTNIDIDEDLVATAMARFRLTSKRAAVDFALQQLIRGSGFEVDNDEIEGDLAANKGLSTPPSGSSSWDLVRRTLVIDSSRSLGSEGAW